MRVFWTALSLLALATCKPQGHGGAAAGWQARGSTAATTAELVPVPLAPLRHSVYPCSDCHAERKTDLTPRQLEEHEEIVLRHGGAERWCFDCHDPDDRDQLRLVNQLVSMADPQLLCGQCHGERYRDWRMGLHGKRVGSWNGQRQYLLCPACHDPHAPRFKPIPPMPAPPHPEQLGVNP